MLELGIGELRILVKFVFVWGSKRLKGRQYIGQAAEQGLNLENEIREFPLEHGDELMDFKKNMQDMLLHLEKMKRYITHFLLKATVEIRGF